MAKTGYQSGGGYPPEDTTPRDTLPTEPQLPMPQPPVGWQSPPVSPEIAPVELPCPHLGRYKAAVEAPRYPLGTEWVCVCGQVYVVGLNKGDKLTLIKREDVAPA